MGPAPILWGAGPEGEEWFLHSGKSPHWQGHQLGERGKFGSLEESTATSLWQAGQSKTYTDGLCHSPAQPSLSCVSAGVEGGWVLEHGVWRMDLGREQQLAMKKQPKGTRVRNSTKGLFVEEAWTTIEAGCHC